MPTGTRETRASPVAVPSNRRTRRARPPGRSRRSVKGSPGPADTRSNERRLPLVDVTDQHITVLLIEDDADCAALIERFLTQARAEEFRVKLAESVADGMACLAEGAIDIVVLDLSLPDSQGLTGFLEVRSHTPQVPVVVLAEYDDEALAFQAMNVGAHDYLVKGRISADLLARSLRYSIERQRMLAEVRQLALVDELTGLSNRRGFLPLAQHHLKLSNRNKTPISLLFMDLQDLRAINAMFGHHEGDRALKDTSAVLRKTFRESDVVARIGGDEFCILLTEAGGEAEYAVLSRLERNVAAHNETGQRRYTLALSVGTSNYDPNHPRSVEELIHAADLSMHDQRLAARAVAS